jgi:hypothetical protein
MKTEQGGTQMWCPNCKEIRVCAAIRLSWLLTEDGSNQRWQKIKHPDLNWFRRGRECQTCHDRFITAEMDEEFLDELVELRDALADIKSHAEQYIEESSAASKTLKKLGKSLSVLKALQLYKKA